MTAIGSNSRRKAKTRDWKQSRERLTDRYVCAEPQLCIDVLVGLVFLKPVQHIPQVVDNLVTRLIDIKFVDVCKCVY